MTIQNVQHALVLSNDTHAENKERWQSILNWYRARGKSAYVPGTVTSTTDHASDPKATEPSQSNRPFETFSEVRTRGLSMFRTIRPPLVRLPASLLPRPEADFYQYGHSKRPSEPALPTPWAHHPSSTCDEELSELDSTDSEELGSELDEEDQLDEGDIDLATAREKDLWALFGADETVEIERSVEVAKKSKKRKRPPSRSEPEAPKKQKAKPKAKPKSGYSVRSTGTKASKVQKHTKPLKPSKPIAKQPPNKKTYKSKEIISDSE